MARLSWCGSSPRRACGFEANAPRSRPRTAGIRDEVAAGKKGENARRCRRMTGAMGMRLFTEWVLAAGLVFTSAAANAQVSAPYSLTSDIEGPYAGARGSYAAVLPEAPPRPADGPRLLPPLEVYTVLREGRFSPLGIPRRRGFVYHIAVIDRGGTTGRLAIDARTGQIVRFVPTSRMGYGTGRTAAAVCRGRRRHRGRRARSQGSQPERPRRHTPAKPSRLMPSPPPHRYSKRRPRRPNRPSRKPPGRSRRPLRPQLRPRPPPRSRPSQRRRSRRPRTCRKCRGWIEVGS